jgi:hypothetical protein
MGSHRVAVVQAASRLSDLAETLHGFESLLAQITRELHLSLKTMMAN